MGAAYAVRGSTGRLRCYRPPQTTQVCLVSNLPLPAVDSSAPSAPPDEPPLAPPETRLAAFILDGLPFIPLMAGAFAARKVLGLHDPVVGGRELPLIFLCAILPGMIAQWWLVAATGQTHAAAHCTTESQARW